MEFKKIKNIKEYVIEKLKSGSLHPIECVKIAIITARKGIPGEKITTIMANGLKETDNVVTIDLYTNKPGWIVTNPMGEEYIVADSVFIEKYELVDGTENCYRPKGKPIIVAQIDESITFVAPWGEEFNLSSGGYIAFSKENAFYGIQEDEFYATYKITDTTEKEAMKIVEEMMKDYF